MSQRVDSNTDFTQKTQKFDHSSPEFKKNFEGKNLNFDTTEKVKKQEMMELQSKKERFKSSSFSFLEKFNNDLKNMKNRVFGPKMVNKSTQVNSHPSGRVLKNKFNKTDSSFKKLFGPRSSQFYGKSRSKRSVSSGNSKSRNFYQKKRLVPGEFIVDSPQKKSSKVENGSKRMSKYLQSFGKCNNFSYDPMTSFQRNGKNLNNFHPNFNSVEFHPRKNRLSVDLHSPLNHIFPSQNNPHVIDESFGQTPPIEPIYKSYNEEMYSKKWKKNGRFSTLKKKIKKKKEFLKKSEYQETQRGGVKDLRDYLKMTNIDEAEYFIKKSENKKNQESIPLQNQGDYGFSFKKTQKDNNHAKPKYILAKQHNPKIEINRKKDKKCLKKYKLKNVLNKVDLRKRQKFKLSLKNLVDNKFSKCGYLAQERRNVGNISNRTVGGKSSNSFIKKNKKNAKKIKKYAKCEFCFQKFEKKDFKFHLSGRCVINGPNFRGSSKKSRTHR